MSQIIKRKSPTRKNIYLQYQKLKVIITHNTVSNLSLSSITFYQFGLLDFNHIQVS